MIPMLGFMASFSNSQASLTEPLDLYLHGYISSRLVRLSGTSPSDEEGLPLTIAATHLDGLVLALTPNHHRYNYRSAILHGFATPVTDADEKIWAMEKITNGVVDDRWANTRIPPTKTEMTSTQILKVRVVDASAKVRAGWPSDDRADMKNDELRAKTWVGVVPTWVTYGAPVPSPDNKLSKVPICNWNLAVDVMKADEEIGAAISGRFCEA
jgi:nitroimidazol reductase NimA-like FMN-containing flavoprotein (pyridoxamine 5'-phosphate oxidase superfamily)